MDKQNQGSFIQLKRNRSSFIKNEKIFEYSQGHLKGHELQEIKSYIDTSPEAQSLLKSLEASGSYANRLQSLYISQELTEKIRHYNNYWSELYEKITFKNWPQSFRLFVESFLMAGIVFIVLTVTPWSKVRDWWKLSFEKVSFTRVAKDQNLTNPAHNKPQEPVLPVVTHSDTSGRPPVAVTHSPTKAPVVEQNPVVTKSPPVSAKTDPRGAQTTKVAREGYLYRLFMKLPNLDVVTIQIVEQIKTMGGEKAGEVPLGWRRSQPSHDGQGEVRGSYFHFTLPEENLEPLFARLKSYGALEVNKESHPRVMPEGTERFILWIESASTSPAKKEVPQIKSSPVNTSHQNADQPEAQPSAPTEADPVDDAGSAETPQE